MPHHREESGVSHKADEGTTTATTAMSTDETTTTAGDTAGGATQQTTTTPTAGPEENYGLGVTQQEKSEEGKMAPGDATWGVQVSGWCMGHQLVGG